jgi:exosome complex exonuclease RRP6
VFTDSKIVKVFHGANMDIEWLQKDFGVYVVNLFDTFHASRFLKLPNASLAYLLKEFCKVNANKEYQRADWRTRPLPKGKI